MLGSGSLRSASSAASAAAYSPSSRELMAGSAIFDVPALFDFSLVRRASLLAKVRFKRSSNAGVSCLHASQFVLSPQAHGSALGLLFNLQP